MEIIKFALNSNLKTSGVGLNTHLHDALVTHWEDWPLVQSLAKYEETLALKLCEKGILRWHFVYYRNWGCAACYTSILMILVQGTALIFKVF